MTKRRMTYVLVWLILAGVFLWLAMDFRLHWDEPHYLYLSGFIELGELLDSDRIHATGAYFHVSRIIHIMLAKAVLSITGPGLVGLAAVAGAYFVMLLAVLALTHAILRQVLGASRCLLPGVVLTAFSPIFLYLSFKTLPETPGLLLAALSLYALLRAMRGGVLWWLAVSSVSLGASMLAKNNMSPLILTGVVSLLLFKRDVFAPMKLMGYFVIVLFGGATVFFAMLYGLGLDWSTYAQTSIGAHGEEEPWSSVVLHFGQVAGVFYLTLPLAFLSPRKKEAAFMAVWFGLATFPLLLFTRSIEARYIAYCLIPLAGLITLTLEGIAQRLSHGGRPRIAAAKVIALVAAVSIVGTDLLILPIMSHEVRVDQFHRVLQRLDDDFGRGGYVILVPYLWTDLQYLRVAHPEREVCSVYRGYELLRTTDPVRLSRQRARAQWLWGEFLIDTPAQLEALGDRPLVYLGFEENHSVAELRALARRWPLGNLSREFEKMTFMNHLELGWPWRHPAIELTEHRRVGHYIAYILEVRDDPAESR